MEAEAGRVVTCLARVVPAVARMSLRVLNAAVYLSLGLVTTHTIALRAALSLCAARPFRSPFACRQEAARKYGNLVGSISHGC